MTHKKKYKYVRKRHHLIVKVARAIVAPFIRRKLGYQLQAFDLSALGPSLIISNHVTPFDPIFVTDTFNEQVYYIASEIIFSNGFISRLLEFSFAPIPKTKSQTDVTAIKQMISIAREGGHVGVFVEGNSSFNGAMYPFADSIGKLVLMLKLPLVIFNFKGGYLTKPRWSIYQKKGQFTGFVREVIPYESYRTMSAEAITELIREKINIDAYQDSLDADYVGKNRAEGLQRLLFSCPVCHHVNSVSTKGHDFMCKDCGYISEYDTRGYLTLPDRGKVDLVSLDRENIKHYERYLEQHRDFSLSFEGELLHLLKRRRKHLGAVEITLAYNGLTMVQKRHGDMTLFPLSQIDAVAVQQQAMLIFYIENQPTIAVKLNQTDSPYQMMKTFDIFKALSQKE